MLLAEANQWPADVRDYFGNSDEFHMAFHFSVDASDVHGREAGRSEADHRDLEQTPQILKIASVYFPAQS